MKENHELTNQMIAQNYRDYLFMLNLKDFTSALAYWLVRQTQPEYYQLIGFAVHSYMTHLINKKFIDKDEPYWLTYDEVHNLTLDTFFDEISEIKAFNETTNDFVCLGALSRNVFYHILRMKITDDNIFISKVA